MKKICVRCGTPTEEYLFLHIHERRARRYVCPAHKDEYEQEHARDGIQLEVPAPANLARAPKPKSLPARPCLECGTHTTKFVMELRRVRMRKRYLCCDDHREKFFRREDDGKRIVGRLHFPSTMPQKEMRDLRMTPTEVIEDATDYQKDPIVRRAEAVQAKCDGSTWSDVMYSLIH